MTWWQWLLLAWIPSSFALGLLVGRAARLRDDPSGPRVRVERRTR